MDMSGAHTAHDDQQHDDREGNDPTQKPTKSRKHKSINPNNDEPNKKLESYSCRFCGKSFEKYQALGGHIGKLHSEEHEEEKSQKPQKLVKKKKQQQLSTSHNSHLSFGGGLATEIAPDPSGPPLGITCPVPTFDALPLNNSTAYYNHYPVGLDHFNMPVQSFPTLNYMRESNFGIPVQHIHENLHRSEDRNMGSYVQLAQVNMSVSSSPYLTSTIESDSLGNHLEPIPGNSHSNHESNMNFDVLQHANGLPNGPMPNQSMTHEMIEEMIEEMSARTSPYLIIESDSLGTSLGQIQGNPQSNQDSNNIHEFFMNSGVPQAAFAFQNEPMRDSFHEHDLADEVIEEKIYHHLSDHIAPNPLHVSYEKHM